MNDDKEKIVVGTIGHVDHGKTTLTAALTRVNELEKSKSDVFEEQIVTNDQIDNFLFGGDSILTRMKKMGMRWKRSKTKGPRSRAEILRKRKNAKQGRKAARLRK